MKQYSSKLTVVGTYQHQRRKRLAARLLRWPWKPTQKRVA